MKNIVVLGAGESGFGAAYLAKKKSLTIFVSDLGAISENYKNKLKENDIDFEEKQHTESIILKADTIIKSPGIPDKAPLIVKASKKGIPVISEIEFAYKYSKGKILAITGSNGKTTTTTLAYDLAKRNSESVAMCGNIGQSYAYQVANDDKKYYILELSSFQLDGIVAFKPDIAIVLNITPDHLDRYDYKLEKYIVSKFRIAMNQDKNQTLILSADDKILKEFTSKNELKPSIEWFSSESAKSVQGFLTEDELKLNTERITYTMPKNKIALKGKHNHTNALAAALGVSELLKIRKQTIRDCFMDVQPIPHRLEKVTELKGVEYINDSKATNVNSTYYALNSMEKPVVWIVGGVDKGNDYTEILDLVKQKVKAIICLGTNNEKLFVFFEKHIQFITEVNSMEKAVLKAKDISQKGDTVLLSPCCASFDLFKNYEDRGNQFKKCVNQQS